MSGEKKYSPHELHDIALGDKDAYAALMVLYGYAKIKSPAKEPCPEGIGVITTRSGFVANARGKMKKETGYDIFLSEKEWDCLWYIACKIDTEV